MSDTPTPDETTPDEGQQDNLAELRRAADEGRKARDTAARLERELAFTKAGIDTESGVGKLLFQSYTGDATKDAVLAAAAEYGINPAAATVEPPAIPDEEREQSRARADLATGAEVPSAPDEGNPAEVGLARFQEARRQGSSPEDASVAFFDTVLSAAYSGDERAIYTPEGWRRRAQG